MRHDSGPEKSNSAFEVLGRVAGALIYVIAAVIAVDVLGRLLEAPVRWPFEVYPYLAYWSALLGAGYVTYRGGNVTMDLLVEEGWLGPFQKAQPVVASLVSVAYFIFVIWAGLMLASDLVASGRMTYELRVPLFYHALALPIGFTLAALAEFVRAARRGSKES